MAASTQIACSALGLLAAAALASGSALAQIGELPSHAAPAAKAGPAAKPPPTAAAPVPPGIRVIPLPSAGSRGDPNTGQTPSAAAAPGTSANAIPAPSETPPAAAPRSESPPPPPAAAPQRESRAPDFERAERGRDRLEERERFDDRRRGDRRRLRDWQRALGPFALAALCDHDLWRVLGVYLRVVEQAVAPTDAQRAALAELRQSAARAEDEMRATCAAEVDTAPAARLAAIEARLASVMQGVRTVRPALDAFYAALSEEQKARFDSLTEEPRRRARHHGRRWSRR